MKLFLDTAAIDEIRVAASWGVLDGVTTNPSLFAKVGGSYDAVLREICALTPGPVSAEVVAEDVEGMLREGRHFATLAPNIVVKVPMSEAGLEAERAVAKAIEERFGGAARFLPLACVGAGVRESQQGAVADAGNVLELAAVAEGDEQLDRGGEIVLRDLRFSEAQVGFAEEGGRLARGDGGELLGGGIGVALVQQARAQPQLHAAPQQIPLVALHLLQQPPVDRRHHPQRAASVARQHFIQRRRAAIELLGPRHLVSDQPSRLPATIRSRCQRVEAPLPGPQQAQAWLRENGAPAALVDQALAVALGNPGLGVVKVDIVQPCGA